MHRLLSWQTFIDIVWLLFLIGLLYFFWKRRKISKCAKNWLVAMGQVEELSWNNDSKEAWIQVRYTYRIDEQTYEGDRLFLDSLNNNQTNRYSRKIAYAIAVAFKNDESVEVFYNPADPRDSALNVQVPQKLNIIIVLLSVLLLWQAVSAIVS